MSTSAILIGASAAIPLLLGSLHLLYTFRGQRLFPRDATLIEHMKADSPRLTDQTSVWRSSVGFHASHSLGAMLFGVIYLYFALGAAPVLFASPFLLGVGFAYVAAMAWLAWRYWFSVPFRGMVASVLLYAAGIAVQLA